MTQTTHGIPYTVPVYDPRHCHGYMGLHTHLGASQATLGGVQGRSTEIAGNVTNKINAFLVVIRHTNDSIYMFMSSTLCLNLINVS